MGIIGRGDSRLIELDDGSLIEVTSSEYDARPVSSRFADRVSGSLRTISPMIEAACRPIFRALEEVQSSEGRISKAEVELGFNLEPEGNIYITKSANEAAIKVRLTLERREYP